MFVCGCVMEVFTSHFMHSSPSVAMLIFSCCMKLPHLVEMINFVLRFLRVIIGMELLDDDTVTAGRYVMVGNAVDFSVCSLPQCITDSHLMGFARVFRGLKRQLLAFFIPDN
jgi:hypothetical protein